MNKETSPETKPRAQKLTPKTRRRINKNPRPKRKNNRPEVVFEPQIERVRREVEKFFTNLNNFDTMYNYLKNYQLYVFEWGVTNYAKKYGTKYNIQPKTGNPYEFIVYDRYKDKLKPYTKDLFDFYARGVTFEAGVSETETFKTTIGQLHMFAWAIEHHVLTFIVKLYDDIKRDYELRGKHKTHRTPGQKRELSASLSRSACVISDESDITDVIAS